MLMEHIYPALHFLYVVVGVNTPKQRPRGCGPGAVERRQNKEIVTNNDNTGHPGPVVAMST